MQVCVGLTPEPRPFATSADRRVTTHVRTRDHMCVCVCVCVFVQACVIVCVYVCCVYVCKYTELHTHSHTHTQTNVVPGTHSLFVDVRDRDFQDTEETYDSVLQYQKALLAPILCSTFFFFETYDSVLQYQKALLAPILCSTFVFVFVFVVDHISSPEFSVGTFLVFFVSFFLKLNFLFLLLMRFHVQNLLVNRFLFFC